MSDKGQSILLCVVGVLALLAIIAVPLLSLWAVNMLFGLGIPYTATTWGAALVLIVVMRSPTAGRGE